MASAAATQSAINAFGSSQNWLRGNLIGELCLTDGLLTILHNKNGDLNYVGLPEDGKQLHAQMVIFKNQYKKKLKNVIRKEQWNIICPSTGVSNSRDWDITIIKVVIQYKVLHLRPPIGEWKNAVVDPTDLSTAADVCRARDVRNRLKHGTIKTLAVVAIYDNILTEVEHLLLRLGYQNMKLFNDLKTGSLMFYTSQIMNLLKDKVNDMEQKVNNVDQKVDSMDRKVNIVDNKFDNTNNKVDDINNELKELQKELQKRKSDIDSKFQEFKDEVQHIKDILQEVNTNVGDLDRMTQSTINAIKDAIKDIKRILNEKIKDAIKDIERILNEKIHQNTLRIKALEHHIREPDPKDIVLPECLEICLEIVSNNIGDDWRKLSDLLHLPTEGTSEQQQPHLNMKKCFENSGNQISWKTLKIGLEIAGRDDLVGELKDETNLSNAISRAIKRHRQKQMETCEIANAIDPFMRKTNDLPPAKRRRDEVFVDLTVVSQKTYIKKYTELENFMQRMTENKDNITLEQLVETKDKFVLITGNAGIGKSELIDTVILKWSKGELLNGNNGMPNIELLFPIKCRELNTIDFLPSDTFQSILQRLFPEVFQEITFDDLHDLSHKVMFVVDGLDEMMSIEQLNHPASIKNLRVQKMVQFVRDVLVSNTKVFPNQYAVAVGRPNISRSIEQSLDKRMSVKCVYVCGFSQNSVDEYIQRNCDAIIQEKVTREIELSQNLAAMSHVPVYLWVICDIYKDDIAIEAPRTTTELMMYACLVFIRRHLIDYEKDIKNLTLSKLCDRKDIMRLIKSISWMSFDSLLQKRVLFENQDLGDIIQDVEELEKKTGFIVKSSNGELGDLYQFSHLVLHELFCGLHMLFSPDVQFVVQHESRLHLKIDGTYVDRIFQNCYPIVASVEGMILDGNRKSILFYFLKRLDDAYNNKVAMLKKLMPKLHQTFDVQTHCQLMYLRCCFESNCEIPPDISKFVESKHSPICIHNLLALRYYHHFYQKLDSVNVVIDNVQILFPTRNLHKSDIESLTYLLNIGKSHRYINGCTQVYEQLAKNLKDSNCKLERVSISYLYDEGIFLILPYLKKIITDTLGYLEIRHPCDRKKSEEQLLKATALFNKINEQYEPCKYKLEELQTHLDGDNDYIEAVCNTMQHLQILEITTEERLEARLSHLNEKVKVLSESGRLKLKKLRLFSHRRVGIVPYINLIDCIKYIPNIVCEDHLLVVRCTEYSKVFQLWESAIDEWICSSGISIEEIFGKMKIKVYFLKIPNIQSTVIDHFNEKYNDKFVIVVKYRVDYPIGDYLHMKGDDEVRTPSLTYTTFRESDLR